MQQYTVDNRQAQVFHSHPITVKGIFLAKKSTEEQNASVTEEQDIPSVSRSVPCSAHKSRRKVIRQHSTPAEEPLAWRWLNKDGSNRGAKRDGKHLLLAPGSSSALRILPLISGPSQTTFLRGGSDETGSQTHTKTQQRSTPTLECD